MGTLPNLSTNKVLAACDRKLRRVYGLPRHGNKANPLSELIYIVLSRQTNEYNFRQAYVRLRKECSSWQNLIIFSVFKIKRLIDRAGLGEQRARELKAIALKLKSNFGKVTLAPLMAFSREDAEHYLCGLPGVGK